MHQSLAVAPAFRFLKGRNGAAKSIAPHLYAHAAGGLRGDLGRLLHFIGCLIFGGTWRVGVMHARLVGVLMGDYSGQLTT